MSGTGTLTVLSSGRQLSSPGRLQVTARIRELLESLTPKFDLVVIDTPPVNLLADAAILGSAADAVLLVVRAGHTQIDAVRYATDRLAAARAPVIGTLLNDVQRRHAVDDDSYRYMTDVARYYAAATP
jgi:polysaccharide biosynthesis transport protein